MKKLALKSFFNINQKFGNVIYIFIYITVIQIITSQYYDSYVNKIISSPKPDLHAQQKENEGETAPVSCKYVTKPRGSLGKSRHRAAAGAKRRFARENHK